MFSRSLKAEGSIPAHSRIDPTTPCISFISAGPTFRHFPWGALARGGSRAFGGESWYIAWVGMEPTDGPVPPSCSRSSDAR